MQTRARARGRLVLLALLFGCVPASLAQRHYRYTSDDGRRCLSTCKSHAYQCLAYCDAGNGACAANCLSGEDSCADACPDLTRVPEP